MKRVTILTSRWALALMAIAAGLACSSDDTEPAVGRSMATGGSAPVGAGGAPAAPVAAPGGTASVVTPVPPAAANAEGTPPIAAPPAAGGTGNAAAGAMAGAAGASMGAAGAAPMPPAAAETPAGGLCPDAAESPSDGVACTVTCTDPCGVQNLGARVCTCTDALFDCATCEFAVPHPLLEPPTEPLVDCDASDDVQEDDESGCVDNERCQSIGRTPGATDGANRFCGCLDNGWDCDTKPASFGG